MWAIFWSGQFYQWSFEIAIDLKGFCSKTLWLFYSNDCIAFCVCERYITKWLGCSSSLCYVCAASFFSTSVKDTTKMISKRSGKTEIFANETRKKWKTNTSTLICIFRIHIHLEIRAKHERKKTPYTQQQQQSKSRRMRKRISATDWLIAIPIQLMWNN